MWSQVGSLDEGADITAIYMLISKENNCKTFPPMARALRTCISPALRNSHLFVLQQGRGAPAPPCRVPRAAPGTGSVPASHGERQGLGWGILWQKRRLRRRALSQPPGPWPSVGEAPGRDYVFVVLFLVPVSHCVLVVWITMVTRVIFPQENNPSPKTIVEPPFWTLCMDGFLSVCSEVVFHCRPGVGRESGAQPKHSRGSSSICGQEFPIFLLHEQAGSWMGEAWKIRANLKNKRHIGYPAFPLSLLPCIPNRVMLRNASSLEFKTDRLPVFLEQLILLACYYSPSAIFKLWHKTREKKRLKFWPVRYPDTWDAVLIWEYLYHKDFLGGFRDPSVNK